MDGDGEDSTIAGKMNGKGNVVCSDTEETFTTTGDGGEYVNLSDRKLETTCSSLDVLATPWLLWPAFLISIIVGASSAPVMVTMTSAAPISMTGWRHQISALVLLPGFIYQWTRMSKLDRQHFFMPTNLGLQFLSAVALAGSLVTYIWALYNTSMTHCLFLISMSPIFLALYTKLIGGILLSGEIVGVTFGLAGVTILGAGTRVEEDNQTTYLGDSVALFSSVAMAIYLVFCKRLRTWMPLFVYQFPVALGAAIVLGVAGILCEGWNESGDGSGYVSGPFSWVRKEFLPGVIVLGAGAGVIGSAGYSYVVRYLSPLVLVTGLSLQPILGSILGWALGESPTPGLWTCVGGAVTLIGTLYVSCSNVKHNLKKIRQTKVLEDDYQKPAAEDEEGQQGKKPLLQPSELP